jgi:hypothetical protein
MSAVEDFQKVIKAYQALGKDDFLVGEQMVAEFFEELTGLEDFLDQGPRESDDHFVERVKGTLKEVAPIVNTIPERELAGPFSFTFLDGSFLISDFSQSNTLALAMGDHILNSLPSRVGQWYAEESIRNDALDFILNYEPQYAKQFAGFVKEIIPEVQDAASKAGLKAFKDALLTATPNEKKAPVAATQSLTLANASKTTVAKAFESDTKLIKHLTKYVPAALELKYITNIWGSSDPTHNSDAIIFTDQHLLIVGAGYGGWLDGGTSTDVFIPVQNIDHLALGSAHHVQYSGFTSSDSNYWTVAIITTDGAVYERYISLGSGEKQINESRQRLTKTFQYLSNFFTVTVDGGHVESTDGYTTTMSYGVWNTF